MPALYKAIEDAPNDELTWEAEQHRRASELTVNQAYWRDSGKRIPFEQAMHMKHEAILKEIATLLGIENVIKP